MRHLFPHVEAIYKTGSGDYMTLYLSRVPFPRGVFDDSQTDRVRATQLRRGGVTSCEVKVPKEAQMVSALAAAIHGLRSFTV
jgi:hypothetical protein